MNNLQIKKDIDAIAKVDRHVAAALNRYGYPAISMQSCGLEALLAAIVNQQLSTKAANTILSRVKALLPDCNADTVLRIPDATLRDAGLSWRKVGYVKSLARSIKSGDFAPDDLPGMDDESAIESITGLHGFGRWSAEIYLLFSLGRRDVFPADDLILRVSLQKIKRLKTRPAPALARKKVAHWQPWRSAGSLFLWHCHNNK